MDSFWSSSPAGKIDEKYSKMADYTIVRPENPDISDIPMDAFVTDEVRTFYGLSLLWLLLCVRVVVVVGMMVLLLFDSDVGGVWW